MNSYCRTLWWDKPRNIHDEIVHAAEFLRIDHIVRLTGDCPLITTEDIQHAINSYRGEYIYHGPDGRDVEIFPLKEFEKFPNDNDWPTKFFHHSGLSLDTQEDYEKICTILRNRHKTDSSSAHLGQVWDPQIGDLSIAFMPCTAIRFAHVTLPRVCRQDFHCRTLICTRWGASFVRFRYNLELLMRRSYVWHLIHWEFLNQSQLRPKGDMT